MPASAMSTEKPAVKMIVGFLGAFVGFLGLGHLVAKDRRWRAWCGRGYVLLFGWALAWATSSFTGLLYVLPTFDLVETGPWAFLAVCAIHVVELWTSKMPPKSVRVAVQVVWPGTWWLWGRPAPTTMGRGFLILFGASTIQAMLLFAIAVTLGSHFGWFRPPLMVFWSVFYVCLMLEPWARRLMTRNLSNPQ